MILKFSSAAAALILASGLAFAQTTTTEPTTGSKLDCPVAGTVDPSKIPAECKDQNNAASTTAPKQDNAATTTPDTTTTGTATTTTDPAANNTTATTTDPAANTGSTTDPAATSTTATTTTDPAKTTTTASVPSGGVLASQFMGQTVYSGSNENVGEINDLVMTKDLDNVVAIIGVGGFLGIGEKDVAIPINEITATKDANNTLHLTIAATKQQLEAAPAFDRTVLR